MFRHLSIDGLLLISLMLDEEDQQKIKWRSNRFVGTSYVEKTKTEGDYWTRQLVDKDDIFFKIFSYESLSTSSYINKNQTSYHQTKYNVQNSNIVGQRKTTSLFKVINII